MISEKVVIFGASIRYVYIFSDLSLYTQAGHGYFLLRLIGTCDGCDGARESINKPVADTYWSVLENVTFYMHVQVARSLNGNGL